MMWNLRWRVYLLILMGFLILMITYVEQLERRQSNSQTYGYNFSWESVDGAENYRIVRMDLENQKEIITVIWNACDTGECWKRNVKLTVSLENNIGFNIECLVDGLWISVPGYVNNSN